MILKISIIFSILTSSINALAENKFCLIGGGGEPSALSTTIFDRQLKNLGEFSQKANYKSCVYFNGGHETTEQIRDNGFLKAEVKENFSQATFNDFLERLKADIKSGKVKNQEQALIYIAAHGEKSNAYSKAHNIAGSGAIANAANFSGSEKIDLAKLQDIIDLAESKGVKLAIVDASCFSGHTLKLKTKNTCLISATGKEHYAYANNPFKNMPDSPLKNLHSFGDLFTQNLSSKRFTNLEDAFLNARKDSIGADFPEINTAEGLAVQEVLYRGISDYLNMEAANINQLSDLFDKTNSQEAICRFENTFQSTMHTLTRLEKQVANTLSNQSSPFKALRKHLTQYHTALTQKMSAEVALKTNQFPNVQLKINGTNYSFPMNLFLLKRPQDIIKERLKAKAEELEGLRRNGTFDQYKTEVESQYNREIALHEAIEKEQKRLIASSPTLKSYYDWHNTLDETNTLAFKIGIEARRVYQDLYQVQKSMDKPSNPCRDFKL